jgi:DNA polymerase V
MPRGGKRKGAGRPRGEEPTRVVRLPISIIESLETSQDYEMPLYGNSVSAGFPSPADDYIEQKLDLNRYLVKHPAATFFVRANGDSMINAGIYNGDILVVDRSLEPSNGKVVIVALDGELTVKRLKKDKAGIFLMPENPKYKPIPVEDSNELHVWGVVTNVIHQVS